MAKHSFFKLIENRHSCRRFQPKKVSVSKLGKVIYVARSAPSAGNLKAYAITIVEEDTPRKKLAEAAFNQGFIAEAPQVLIFWSDTSRNSAKYDTRAGFYAIQDATIACSYAQLAAEALGLSSCWVGAFDEQEVTRAVGGSLFLQPIALLAIGYK